MTITLKTIGDICEVTDYVANGSFKELKENTEFESEKYAVFVRLTDFTKGWNGDYKFVDKESYEFLKKSKLVKGDLIIANVGNPGKSFILPDLNKPMTLGPNSILVRPNQKLIRTKYLKYLIDSELGQKLIQSITTGATQQKFNKTNFKNIQIPVPPIEEQEKIINKLDKTFERTNNYKLKIDESLINVKKLFLSVLDKEFKPKGNERSQLKKLSEISAIKGGKRVPKGYKLLDKKTQFPYIRVTDFDNNGGIDESNLKFIDENIHNQIKNYTIHSCDLFISIAGTVGKSGMVPNHLDGANLTENACKLIFEDNTHNKFIYYFTKSNFFKNQVLEKTKTASQPKLALSRLGEIVLQLPPLEDQLELTNKFIEVEKYINTLISKKDALMFELDLLKKSVLNKEFSHVE